MEVSEVIYEGARAPSKNEHPKVDANCTSGGNQNVGESASRTGFGKSRADKRKSNHDDCLKIDNSDALPCMIHSYGKYSEYYRFMRKYEGKYCNQSANAGGTITECVKFDKTSINGEEENDMV